MNVKKIPVGIENFEKLRRGGFYYVDKTGLIEKLLEDWEKLICLPVPDVLENPCT